jgi:DNA-binding MarR family transcriptional regulator
MVSNETNCKPRRAMTDPDAEVLELERFLPYRLSVLSNTVSQAIADSYERRFGLAITEWRVMAVLGRYDGQSAREVAARTAMDKVAVSRAVARLIAAGHVRRLTAAHDKRQSVLRLSAKGWKVYAQIAPLALAHERRLLAHLDAEEQEWLGRILDKLWRAELEEIAR